MNKWICSLALPWAHPKFFPWITDSSLFTILLRVPAELGSPVNYVLSHFVMIICVTFFGPCCVACRTRDQTILSVMETWSLDHWTTKESSHLTFQIQWSAVYINLGLLSIRLGQFRGNAIKVIICGNPFHYHFVMIYIVVGSLFKGRSSLREIIYES